MGLWDSLTSAAQTASQTAAQSAKMAQEKAAQMAQGAQQRLAQPTTSSTVNSTTSNSVQSATQGLEQAILNSISRKNMAERMKNKLPGGVSTKDARNVQIPETLRNIATIQSPAKLDLFSGDVIANIIAKNKIDVMNGKSPEVGNQEIKNALNKLANMPNLGDYTVSNSITSSFSTAKDMYNNRTRGGVKKRRHGKKHMRTKRRHR